MSLFGDDDSLCYGNTHLFNLFALLTEDDRVQHYSVTNNVNGTLSEDSCRYGVQNKLFPFKLKRVAGIGAALEPGNSRVGFGKHIYNLALSLIAPLEAQYNINFHNVNMLFNDTLLYIKSPGFVWLGL